MRSIYGRFMRYAPKLIYLCWLISILYNGLNVDMRFEMRPTRIQALKIIFGYNLSRGQNVHMRSNWVLKSNYDSGCIIKTSSARKRQG